VIKMATEPDLESRILVGTPVLDKLEDSNLPFRGERRKRVLRQVSAEVKARRTSTGVARRLSNVTVGTVGQVAVDEARGALEQNLEEIIEQAMDR